MNSTCRFGPAPLCASCQGASQAGGGADRHWREEPIRTLVPVIPAPRLCLEWGPGGRRVFFCLLSSPTLLLAFLLSCYSDRRPVGVSWVLFLLSSSSFPCVPQAWCQLILASPPAEYRPVRGESWLHLRCALTSYVSLGRELNCPGLEFLCKGASASCAGPSYTLPLQAALPVLRSPPRSPA